MYEFLRLTVADYMTAEPVTTTPDTPLGQAQQELERLRVNGLPVLDQGGTYLGIITSLDILRAFANSPRAIVPPYEEIMRRPVESAMSRETTTVTPDLPLNRVLDLLVSKGVRSLPVCDGDGRLVGVVSREDVLRGLRESVR